MIHVDLWTAGLDEGWKVLWARATWRPQMLHGVRRGIRVLPFQSPGTCLGSRPFESRPRSSPPLDFATTREPLARGSVGAVKVDTLLVSTTIFSRRGAGVAVSTSLSAASGAPRRAVGVLIVLGGARLVAGGFTEGGQRRRPRRQISLLWFRVRFSRFVRISASLFLFFAVTPASFSAS